MERRRSIGFGRFLLAGRTSGVPAAGVEGVAGGKGSSTQVSSCDAPLDEEGARRESVVTAGVISGLEDLKY